jgi:DNA-binding GntR family transcriptional regulator
MNDSALHDLTAPSLADQAYEAIRAAITSGELERGEKITERGLAGMLSVSPTPVREAIRRLEQDGLIERRGTRSLAVHDSRASSDHEFALIEASLKALAVRFAATNATPAALRRMAEHLDEADVHRDEMQRLVDEGGPYPDQTAELLLLTLRSFHSELEGACGNAVRRRQVKACCLLHDDAQGPRIGDQHEQPAQPRDPIAELRRRRPCVVAELRRQGRALFIHAEQRTRILGRRVVRVELADFHIVEAVALAFQCG